MTSEKRNDEIDLLELFLKIYIFLKKNFWILFITSLIGGALGYSAKFFTKKQHFESTMLVESYTLSDEILIEYINNIQGIIKGKNYEYLLDSNDNEKLILSDLLGVKAEMIYDEKNKSYKEYIRITANSKSKPIFKKLSAILMDCLNQETYINKEIDIFIEQNKSLLEKIDKEIFLLEELQKKKISDSQSKSEVIIYTDQIFSNKDLLSLIKEKQHVEKVSKFATPFRIIQDFSIYKPIQKTKTYTLPGFILFGFIALFLLLIKEINKNIKGLN